MKLSVKILPDKKLLWTKIKRTKKSYKQRRKELKKTIKYNKQQNQPFAAISKELLKVMLKN